MIGYAGLVASLSVIVFCVGYPLFTTSLEITTEYEWHRANFSLFVIAVAITVFFTLGHFSQTRFARIQGVESILDAIRVGLYSYASVLLKLSVFIIATIVVALFISGVVGEMFNLSDDATGMTGIIIGLIISGIALNRSFSHLQTASTNPDAHLHLLMLLAYVSSIILGFSILLFREFSPEELEVWYLIGLTALFSYPLYYILLIANSGFGGMMSVSPIDSPEVVIIGVILGSIFAFSVSIRDVLLLLLLQFMSQLKQVGQVLMFYLISGFNVLILLRPQDSS